MLRRLKKVKLADILGIFIFIIVLIPSLIKKLYLKVTKKEFWLICETKVTARDNGYSFYKYMRKEHPEIITYYAINKKSKDYQKVSDLGNIIQWGSLKHYYYYMSATKNISSHKEGNPNQLLFTILHLYLNLYNNRVFLQHGVLYQDFSMFHFKNTKFKIFITGAKAEYDFVKERYGYFKGEVRYTGLARFDYLYDSKVDKNAILFIPTWRRWLETKEQFEKSTYFKKINELINSKELENMLEKYNKVLYFYPHLSTQKFIDCYKTNNKYIKILDTSNVDVQELLKKGTLLITDFSSIFTDFAYMHKPIIYYQYDSEEFYDKHFRKEDGKSYFDFKKDGFGPVVNNEADLLSQIEKYIKNDFKQQQEYTKKIDKFFLLRDKNNCQRIYKEIIKDDLHEK
ncbi:MAG: CDP-glycerol glycerophosphotransferase family protein [Bacilli bacterium]|nr:CDP-glycerol glycerophosphotransferase family protein [Bacilli bacterium]